MLIDTHAHLYLEQFKEDIPDVINRAKDSNVTKIFLPNIDSGSVEDLHRLCASFPDVCLPLMGLHPCSVKENYKEELQQVEKLLKEREYWGVGETGIDLYWDVSFKEEQIEAFEFQINLAKEHDIPVIIHSRDSLDLTIQIIEDMQDGHLAGVFHCFNGSVNQARKVLDSGFYMGLGGVITFKNAKLDDMINFIPMSSIVLETDAPYLSPVPYRGKRNESAYLAHVVDKISEVKGIDKATIAEVTTQNAKILYRMTD
ncbi:MAG: TatD family hydrolase [Bacteroidia bacterium]|nr:TatD family hydrolase [Bacteroidia bacterium]